jgi:hypothetical protein
MPLNDEEFRRAVARFRDESTPALAFTPALERFLDASFLESIQEEFRANHFKWERRHATPSLASQLPRQRGIYMFVWAPDLSFEFDTATNHHHIVWVLYIGKAGIEGGACDTFQDRYRQAYQRYIGGDPAILWSKENPEAPREKRLERYLTLRPLQFWYLPISDVNYIPVLERRLLQLFRPPLNTQHSGLRARLGKPSPAW